MSEIIKIHGSLFQAFLNAGASLKLLLQGNVEHLQAYDENTWYSFDEFNELLALTTRYKNSEKILEQLGIEMMKAWYKNGPGKPLINSGIGFLQFQSSSQGFLSVIDAPSEIAGKFNLEELDEVRGLARIHSSTIFPRDLERGILIGGLGLAGDLLFFKVENSKDKDDFNISFVDRNNRLTLSWQAENCMTETEWRFQHYVSRSEEKNQFWACINDTLNAAYTELLNVATIDALTGIYNRREFLRLASVELGKSKRSQFPLSLLYLDIDHFKNINDSYGHPVGDKALIAFAGLCREESRQYDLIGRIGGEEFCIMLPLTGLDSAFALAERILKRTRSLIVELPEISLSFTVSIGLAEYDGNGDIDDLINRADKELLLAKHLGRNRLSKPG